MRRAIFAFAAAFGIALAAASPAAAEPAVALMPGNTLLLFDTNAPATTTLRPVTGIGAGETLRGIDQRPATLELYGSTVVTAAAANSPVATYTIDPATGLATLIAATALPGAADVATGYDFNPVVDRIRYVTSAANNENARLNPNNGALAGNDTDLTPALTTDVIAAAYDRSVKDSEQTTLFAINRSASTLSIQGGVNGSPSPNGGAVTNIGPLNVTLAVLADGGFDISRAGTAYAALTSGGLTRLYTVDLITGAATVRGFVGNGMQEVRSLTIFDAKPAGVPAPSLPPVIAPALPTPGPPDTTRPDGAVGYVAPLRRATLLRSGLSAEVGCSEACTISARLQLGKVTLATGSATLPGPGSARVRLKATAQARRTRLSRRGARAELTATLTDAAGNGSIYRRKVTLR